MLELPPAVAKRELAMKQWERALANTHHENFKGMVFSFINLSMPHLEHQRNYLLGIDTEEDESEGT